MGLDTENSEEWRAIPEWDGLYEVSSFGRVRSVTRTVKGRFGPTRYQGRLLKPGYGAKYALVTLVETGRGRRVSAYVHDIVLATFVGPKPVGQEVCHGPLGAHVNTVGNLRYDTRSANAQDRHLFGKGWAKRGHRPPTKVRCEVCQTDMLVIRRRTARYHICKDPECRRIFGQLCMDRKGWNEDGTPAVN